MTESSGERTSEEATIKRNSRMQMLHYKGMLERFDTLDKEDRQGIEGRKQARAEATKIMQMLTSCVGKSNMPFPTAWRGQPYENTLVRLVRTIEGGELHHANRNIVTPGNPKTFVSIVQGFLQQGILPPESESEKRLRERLEEEAQKEAEKTKAANSESSQNQTGYGRYEQRARSEEEARRQQEEAERQRRQQQWRWQRHREERAKQRQYEQEQEEQRQREAKQRREREEAQRRAEEERLRREREAAEARKPENVYRRRLEGARQPNSLRVIIAELDMAFAGFMPDGRTPLPEDQRVSSQLHRRLREVEIPKRAKEIFTSRINAATTTEQLRNEFREIVTCELFRDQKTGNTLSNAGSDMHGLVYGRAINLFQEQIKRATRATQLVGIQREIEGFLGGSLDQPAKPGRRFGFLRPRLSEIERSKMTREQRRRYDEGQGGPHFDGPLSVNERATIAAENKIVYLDPSATNLRKTAEAFLAILEAKREDLESQGTGQP